MDRLKKTTLLKGVVLLIIFLIATYLQTLVYANHDAVWLLHCASQLLQGKTYYYNFFETNPPLILFLYMPAIGLAKLIGCTSFIGLRIYTFIFITLVMLITNRLLNRILPKQTALIFWLIVLWTAYFAILPFFWFAEREHFTALLVLPYLLLTVLRLQNKPVKTSEAICYSLLAALGISLKPYFLIPLVLVEGYYLLHIRKILTYLRPEPICIFLFMVLYLIFIKLFFPVYFNKILPLTEVLYIPVFAKQSYINLLLSNYSFYILLDLLMIGWQILVTKSEQKYLLIVFFLVVLGFLIAYIWPGHTWYYHAYPAIVLGLAILSFMLLNMIQAILKLEVLKGFPIVITLRCFVTLILILLNINLCIWNNLYYFLEKASSHSYTNHLIQYINAHASGENVLIISNTFIQESARYYTTANLTSRFPSMLLVPGLKNLQLTHQNKAYHHYKHLLFKLMLEDVHRFPPAYIFIDREGFWIYKRTRTLKFKFLPFLLSDSKFKDFLSHYHQVAKNKFYIVLKLNNEAAANDKLN
ncbi:MAG: hypothetical protein A3E87_01245 [Gammaproteobacteria bacterium RIFCSPHIGHO2_12_FULL_35_23]|nr:MAG: hypothetical protein A3E87_01245 [Gammaproteobacteria bacterium RIFCSPHIGHO2_12_FULL_35_23]